MPICLSVYIHLKVLLNMVIFLVMFNFSKFKIV